ncbi:MAG: pyridoxamine 5'-phosphate oxidase family protein [bacterium]|nr:pyridoxamine 5'-phosphate oxidase family protein [bacterium]
MGKVLDGIDGKLAKWLEAQPLFFVATAPLTGEGLINLSPKGLHGSFTVIDEHTVAYLDLTGSGIETVAHVRENGRIVIMFCAFDGRPSIVRMHGTGRVVLPETEEFDALIGRFSEHLGTRSIIVVDGHRTSDSCGYAVPKMSLVEERDVLDLSDAKRGADGLVEYRAEKNALSLDGLPGLPAPA